MGFLVSPGVHVKEIDLTNIIPAVQTNIGAVAGPFEKGPVATVVNIGSEEELRSICRSLGLTEDMPDMPREKIEELYKKDSPYYGELPKDLIKKGV